LETDKPQKPPLVERFKALVEKYGTLALIIYFVLFGLVFGGFIVAIAAGVHLRSAAGGVGLLGTAYIATKLTQPFRILATLALVPVVDRLRQRRAPRAASSPGEPDPR
jgi:hypothetical protein